MNGKTLAGPPGGVLRGRGGLIDRGRGRLRGSGGFHYSRGLSCEEQSDNVKDGPPERPFSRSLRSYDRSQVRMIAIRFPFFFFSQFTNQQNLKLVLKKKKYLKIEITIIIRKL